MVSKKSAKIDRSKLEGTYFAYDKDGSVLGKVTYKKGVLVSRRAIKTKNLSRTKDGTRNNNHK